MRITGEGGRGERARAEGSLHLLQSVLHPRVPFWIGKATTVSIAVPRMPGLRLQKNREEKKKGRDARFRRKHRKDPSFAPHRTFS